MPFPNGDSNLHSSVTPEEHVSNAASTSNTGETTPGENLTGYECSYCDKAFPTVRGLEIHKRSKHPEQANAEIDLTRKKYRW